MEGLDVKRRRGPKKLEPFKYTAIHSDSDSYTELLNVEITLEGHIRNAEEMLKKGEWTSDRRERHNKFVKSAKEELSVVKKKLHRMKPKEVQPAKKIRRAKKRKRLKKHRRHRKSV